MFAVSSIYLSKLDFILVSKVPIIEAAYNPALKAPLIGITANGTPLGIFMLSKLSRPLSFLLSIGTPITGRLVSEATIPGRCAAIPAPAHITASIFTFGREQVIPEMFRSIVSKIDKDLKGRLKSFLYYLDRHISLDEDEHTPAALKMVKEICGDDNKKWEEATYAAKKTMQSRITFWDEILLKINSG